MVETFFGIITRQAIRRGTFRSVKDLTAAISAFIDAYNDRCQPFTWTKDADELIPENQTVKELTPRDTSGTRYRFRTASRHPAVPGAPGGPSAAGRGWPGSCPACPPRMTPP